MTTTTAPRSKSRETKAIVDRWFTEFWGMSWNPSVVDELCAPHVLLQYLAQAPHRGRADVRTFMTELREAFPDMSAAPIANDRAAQPMPTELGTLDAIHLATALLWKEFSRTDVIMATHDGALGLAAQAHGLRVVGSSMP